MPRCVRGRCSETFSSWRTSKCHECSFINAFFTSADTRRRSPPRLSLYASTTLRFLCRLGWCNCKG